jgi:hypothetical protein
MFLTSGSADQLTFSAKFRLAEFFMADFQRQHFFRRRRPNSTNFNIFINF